MEVSIPPAPHGDDMRTPTAAHFDSPRSQHPYHRSRQATPSASAPSRDTTNAAEKRPLSPPAPTKQQSLAPQDNDGELNRQESLQSLKSNDTHASSTTGAAEEAVESSDRENNDDTYPPQKKKRSQRFYCKDYPPCNLSFTRSEHLARHIRKHTGERPFTCHCQRRFSRLDNLRQHAQTVHLNEEIPVDSLATTGTRFQRQVRTERMKTPGHRQRTSTMSSGSHSRGHSRNLSGSSIGSVSEFGSPDDGRRRHQPLAMAQPTTPCAGLSVDTYGPSMPAPYYNYSPSGYSTPMSVYSTDATSPRMSSALGSPISMVPRPNIGWGGQNHSRRLSVPSGVNPYHGQQQFIAPQPPFMSPVVQPATPYYTNVSGAYASPPREGAPHSRHQSLDAAEAEYRRRTWHPSTRHSFSSRPATSGLTYQQRPDDPEAVPTTQPAAQQAVRLPGIDSFDRSSMAPSNSSRRRESMDIDAASVAGETEGSSKRTSWNSMNQNMNQLEILQNTPPRDASAWRRSTGSQPPGFQGAGAPAPDEQCAHTHSAVSPGQASASLAIDPALQQPHTPRNAYRPTPSIGDLPTSPSVGEPGPALRTSSDASANSEEVQTPSGPVDLRPTIMHSDGRIERLDPVAAGTAPKVRI
ncbi:MAG: hypothetical protein Q9159_007394 [Coniocarpon cinnabarinum]